MLKSSDMAASGTALKYSLAGIESTRKMNATRTKFSSGQQLEARS
jgi:hypothetical protein